MTRACTLLGAILLAIFMLPGCCPQEPDQGAGGGGGGSDAGAGGGGSDAGTGTPCTPDKVVGDFAFCLVTTASSYDLTVVYQGAGQLDLSAGLTRLNGADVDLSSAFDEPTQTFHLSATGVAPSKYAYLFRLKDQNGSDIRPLFIPFWIGDGIRYADFSWHDAILYEAITDRFRDGDPGNNIDNSVGTLAEVTDVRNQWQGGDFRGLIDKLEDGYFESLGITALAISSPLLNSHNSQPGIDPNNPEKSSAYHSFLPVVTGYTHLNDYGYANPIETAFGTPAELHELVNEAHARGIRVITDLVANHVQIEGQIYQDHPDWFHSYIPCHSNWDTHGIDCWITTATPDFDYDNPAARQAMVDHALWLIQELNLDGFRADALRHVEDVFITDLKAALVEQIETTVENHDLSDEPAVFYLVGDAMNSAYHHVQPDMLQGKVDDWYYLETMYALLRWTESLAQLAAFAIPNDTAYLTPASCPDGGLCGYPGAVMGNIFGNHNFVRALTEAGGDHQRLRLAQTFLLTSPGNIPMLFQGDDIGTLGGPGSDGHKMQKFMPNLSPDEQQSLAHAQAAGLVREAHKALRRGTRQSEVEEDWFWVYRVTYEDDEVYVAINRESNQKTFQQLPAGYTDVLGSCTGNTVPSLSSCIFVK